jgi:hypothetical protein
MTSVTPTAGVAPLVEGGPGAFPAPPFPHSAECVDGVGSPVIGRLGRPPVGLALRLADCNGPSETFEIAILDGDGATLLRLGPYEAEDVVAEWRAIGATSGLPLVLERPDGSREMPYPQIGRLQLGAIRIRRRHGLLNGRRPRFLVRRKTGRLPLRPSIHREREITGSSRG